MHSFVVLFCRSTRPSLLCPNPGLLPFCLQHHGLNSSNAGSELPRWVQTFCNASQRKSSLARSGLKVGTPRCGAVAGVTPRYSTTGEEAWAGWVMVQSSVWLHCYPGPAMLSYFKPAWSLLQTQLWCWAERRVLGEVPAGMCEVMQAAAALLSCSGWLLGRSSARLRPASAATVHSPAPFCRLVFSALSGWNVGAGEVQASIMLPAFGVGAERQGQ